MKVIIDIPKEKYDWIMSHLTLDRNFRECKITPLSEQHGKIIDADSIPSYRIRGVTEYCRGYNDRTTEVENDIKNAPIIIEANY